MLVMINNKTSLTLIPTIALFLCCTIEQICLQKIPVALWNIRGKVLTIKPIPKFQQNAELCSTILESATKDGAHILIFVINKSFLDTCPHVFISSVNTLLSYVDKVHCNIQEIEVNQSLNNSNILQRISSELSKFCIVVIHISDVVWSEIQGSVRNVFLLSSEHFSFNVIGVFTAEEPSWVSQIDHHISRKLLQTEDEQVPSGDVINYNDCILFYSSSINIIAKKLYDGTLNLASPSTTGSCTKKSAMLLLTYKPAKYTIDEIIIKFVFKNRGTSWQTYTTLNITTNKASYKYLLTSSNVSIGAASERSYFCSNALMKPTNQKYKIALFFSKLKIQPFSIKNKNFSKSHICEPASNIITIEIFECVIVSLLFIAIISWGISYLVSMQTMERFDDPKDKTLSVTIITPN